MAPQPVAPLPHDSASYPSDPPAPQHFSQPSVPAPPRVVWPWTTFLLGLAALAGVYFGRPYWKPSDAQVVRRELAELRSILGTPNPDLGRAVVLGQKALDMGGAYPQFVGEAHYLLGCVHLKKADESPDIEGEYRDAHKHFEQAELAGVPEDDQPSLAFQMGKVLHLTRGDPNQALAYLKKSEDPKRPEDPNAAERWQLIGESCLRQNPPDLKGAIQAVANHAALIPSDGRGRSQAYLRLAELHLKLNQVGPARKALEEIRADDSGDAYDTSRVLLARCLQAEGSYGPAAQAWEQVKSKPRPPIDRGTICFELGTCYWKAARPDDARKVWDEAQSLGSEAAQASMLRKAQMQLGDLPNRALAIPLLEDALRTVQRPVDYRNSLIPREQVEQLLDQTCRQFQETREWSHAGKLAELVTRVAGPARGKELATGVALAWGATLQAEARQQSGQAALHCHEEACKQFRVAATLAAELAALERPEIEQAEWRRKAATYFLMCNDKVDIQNALALLEKVPGGGNSGEISYMKAVAHEQLGETDKAIEGYQACVSESHPERHRARYQMVRLMLAQQVADRTERQRRLDQAIEELTPNLDPKLHETQPLEAEQSSYLMGYIHYEKRDFAKAQEQLAAALKQYPDSIEATNSRFLLGRCYWFQAGKESPAVHNPELPDPERAAARKRMNELLEKARGVFEPLEDALQKREQDQQLSDADRLILRQASFAAAECYFFMEDFPEAVRRYNMLRLRYARQIEELIALAQLWQCYAIYLDRKEQGEATLGAMRELLKSLPDEAFDGTSAIHQRAFWDDWIKKAVSPSESASTESSSTPKKETP